MKKGLLCITLFTITTFYAQQKQEIKNDSIKSEKLDLVTIDSRFKIKRENSGKSVIKITAKELIQNQGKTIVEIINLKSGIEINGSRSNAGQNLNYFVRGGNNRQVLVLIDDLQVSDPSQIENNYDLRLIDVNQVESIEIIKGASSTLYGNNAATTVINITTKKASKKPIKATFSTSIGSNQTSDDSQYNIADFTNAISVNGSSKKTTYLASFLHQFTDGMSATKNDTERDAFNRINVNTKIGYQFSNTLNINLYANHTKLKFGFDDAYFIDDAFTKNEQNRVGTSLKYDYNNQGNVTINTSYSTIFRNVTSSFSNKFESKSFVVDAFNKYKINKDIYTIIGINYIENKAVFNQEQKTNIIDPYLNMVWISNFGLNLNVGARLNNHSEYGSHLIYNLNPSFTYNFEGNYVKVLGSFSTSYIAPSLYQLYGDGGFVLPNLTLEPEENTTIEAGFEVNLKDKVTLSTVFFKRNEVNAKGYETVDFITYQGQYTNTTEDAVVNGFEVEFKSSLLKKLDLTANYTFVEKKDIVSLKLPKHKVNANLSYDINYKSSISLNYQYVDDRLDVFFNPITYTQDYKNLKSFMLVDLNYQTEIIKNRLKVHTSISNIFNEDYTELYGFSTKGRNIKLGLNITF